MLVFSSSVVWRASNPAVKHRLLGLHLLSGSTTEQLLVYVCTAEEVVCFLQVSHVGCLAPTRSDYLRWRFGIPCYIVWGAAGRIAWCWTLGGRGGHSAYCPWAELYCGGDSELGWSTRARLPLLICRALKRG